MDFRFEIIAFEEPEMGSTHLVIQHETTDAGVDTGVEMERFTTDDPYGAVEAARVSQASQVPTGTICPECGSDPCYNICPLSGASAYYASHDLD